MTLILLAASLGLGTGLLAWFVGAASAHSDRVAPLAAQVERLRVSPRTGPSGSALSAATLASSPIFPLTVGPGAVREPAIRVDGVALTPRRRAALVSIDGAAAEWLLPGESRSGVTLLEVARSGITVETIIGNRDVAVGESIGAAPADAAAAVPSGSTPAGATPDRPVVPTIIDQPPPGVRSPPPPASAPR